MSGVPPARPPDPPEPPDPLIGMTIGKHWRLLGRLGAGAMGVVYRATRNDRAFPVALKLIHQEQLANQDMVRRFAREARVLGRLKHVHCAAILEVGEHDGRPYIVMEMVLGHLLTREIGTQAMTPVRSVKLAQQTLAGLAHAHTQGIIHRDLKPDNLMIADGDVVKILDFGFARFTDPHNSQSNANLVPGTPSYMPPEAARGVKTDPRSDLYSVGVVLYELCTGKRPFIADHPFAILTKHIKERPVPAGLAAPDRGISPGLESVIGRALEKSPDDRFQSAAAFSEGLANTPEGLAVERQLREVLAEGVRPPPRTKRAVVAVAATVLALGAAVLAIRRGSAPAAALPGPPPVAASVEAKAPPPAVEKEEAPAAAPERLPPPAEAPPPMVVTPPPVALPPAAAVAQAAAAVDPSGKSAHHHHHHHGSRHH